MKIRNYSYLVPVLLILSFPGSLCLKTEGRPIFNGKDLSGWVVMHGGEWTVEDGVLVGRNGKGIR